MLLAVGLNYQKSHIEVREAYAPNDRCQALTQAIASLAFVDEVFILSTCNRTEIYCLVSSDIMSTLDEGRPASAEACLQQLINLWHTTLGVAEAPRSMTSMFDLWGRDGLEHLVKVAAGLEAMILGEPQILGQVKAAVKNAAEWGTLGTGLQKLLNPVFELAKHVRSSTAIGRSPITFASATYQLASQIFTDLEKCHILLIGAGEMIELVCRHFYHQRSLRLSIANRSNERTARFVSDFGAIAHPLSAIPDLMTSADVIIACTGSSQPLILAEDVKKALQRRKQKPIFIADLAVPRDVQPSVGELDNAFLYTVDDIHQMLHMSKEKRVDAAEAAYQVIQNGMETMLVQHRIQQLSPLITQYREEAETIRQSALADARRLLMRNEDPYAVLEHLSQILTKRLIHKPTKGLRSIASKGSSEQVSTVTHVLGLQQPKDH